MPPGRDILDHVVSKWGALVMLALYDRTYRLTPMGRELAKHIAALGKWIATNTLKVLAAREKYQRAAR